MMHLKAVILFIILISLISVQLKKVKLQRGDNPGKCNENNRGNLTLINDRENNDKLLICVKENNDYVWKTTDGSNPTGEFFNPAYDCSDILNKNPEAKDGLYWIKLSGSVPKMVWCDMTTDGGGYMLIGRTNTSSVWKIPSSHNTVEPFGKSRWSSSLGDAPIIDFRVQLATEEDFSKTRSHWSFRLQNKRPLKKLLIVNKGGCGRLSPGIGDIAYVKDLETEKIVTRTFRCSHFGTNYPESSRFGWDKMNFCFEHPCPGGFAYLYGYPIQIDHSGAFSYSASGQYSGISHNSTSFVGCDNRKCCACFGPPRGKKNYCGTECRTNHGGTTIKNVYTWYWVRSSQPRKQWNKCMEFKVKISKGKVVWYRLYNGNPVPVMGRCSQNEALLNDGIVVVQDNVTAQKVPPVPGLLEYRKDTKKLYVRSNETWNEIGEEKKVLKKAAQQVKPKLDQVERKITNQLNTVFAQLKKNLDQLKVSMNSQLHSVDERINKINKTVLERTCASLYKQGERQDGIYTINPDGLGYFKVWCDMLTDRGGWTVFQRRKDGSVDFHRGWEDYKNGFGDLNGEFWLGLDKIHRLSKSGQNVLRVDLTDCDNNEAYAKYKTFSVASESESYKLNVGSYSGNAGDSLSLHNGVKFSTRDKDNDQYSSVNCAASYKGAWWYNWCHFSNLNGRYLKQGARSSSAMFWSHWKFDRAMKISEMKIHPPGY